jgi:hypothetical protein
VLSASLVVPAGSSPLSIGYFSAGDTLDLGVAATTASWSGGLLTLLDNAANVGEI